MFMTYLGASGDNKPEINGLHTSGILW
jgi:hypothetical protein